MHDGDKEVQRGYLDRLGHLWFRWPPRMIMDMELDVTITEDRICSWEKEMTVSYDSWEEVSDSFDDSYWG